MAGIVFSADGRRSRGITGTFSVVARCSRTSSLGVCVSTAVPAVGSVVPHVEPQVGAVATQGYTRVIYGTDGLRLLEKGLSAQSTLEALLREDSDRELRQIAIIDRKGRKAAFTGEETPPWRGHIFGEDCVAAGNMLASGKVLKAMIGAFEGSEESLAERLVRSLEAGDRAGGDRRGKMSAALLVADEVPVLDARPLLSLRVDAHAEPVKELRRVFETYREWFAGVRGE
ncbi:MAG: DUF1028 domain-containing protein [Candidatus Bathyarchaeota archaeon]|nr:DUF1028 domain-containing protein [Candidatus Bathyarchaeota archaeon]